MPADQDPTELADELADGVDLEELLPGDERPVFLDEAEYDFDPA